MTKNSSGCLLIHGFGGGIHEVENLIPYLEGICKTRCAVLAGHTGRRDDLKNVRYIDWMDSAEKELIKLMEECEHVHIVGFSMGGLVGANLAIKHEVCSLTTINTPIYYWDIEQIVKNIASDIKNRRCQNIKRYMRSSGKFPVSALLNFKILLRKTKSNLELVKCPALIVQALDDDTVRRTSANYIYRNIGSRAKRIESIEGGGHVVLKSSYKNNVGVVVSEFIKSFDDR